MKSLSALDVRRSQFADLGLLVETTGHRRNRVFGYQPYLELFGESGARS
jgi:hypothetical protein